jgi:hypothetical protein
MRLLDISADLGPNASPARLETVVRAIRVTSDVAYDAHVSQIRRAARDRMKFPTDGELRRALEQLTDDDQDRLRYRVQQQLAARDIVATESRRFSPEFWFDYWYRQRRTDTESKQFRTLSNAGYERVPVGPFPFVAALSLDVLDPALYDALVANEVARALPARVAVRSLSYENPFWMSLFGKGDAEKTVSTMVNVVEVARDFGPKRSMAKADAAVAEATVTHRVAESELDVALKQEQLRAARLRNDRIALENASLRLSLGAEERRRVLIERAIQRGLIGIADAIQALAPGDVQALSELEQGNIQVAEHDEPDERDG